MSTQLPLRAAEFRTGDLVRFNSQYKPRPGSVGSQRIGDIMLVVWERHSKSRVPIVILLGRGELFPAMVPELERVQ